jgi:hypothetical protein
MNRRALAMFIGLAVSGAVFAAPAAAAAIPDIVQVELQQCARLHVGYRYIAKPTTVQWEVSEHGRSVSTGEFVADAGHGYHFSTVTLERRLTPGAKAQVRFRTKVGNVVFEYTVTRRTGCIDAVMSTPRQPVSPTGLIVAAPVTSPPPAVSPTQPLPSTPNALAFTGSGGEWWLIGVGLLLLGASLWLLAGPTLATRTARQIRRTAEWFEITTVPRAR